MINNSIFNHPAKIFRYFLVCFLIGVFIRSFFTIEFFWLYLAGLILAVGVLFAWPRKNWRYFLIGGGFIILGILRYQAGLPIVNEEKIWFYNNQRIVFQGIIIKEPDIRINHTKLTVKAEKIKINQAWQKIRGKVLVSVSLYPVYNYGEVVEISCQLKAPERFNDFAYDRYLAKSDIYSLCSYPKVKLIEPDHGNWLLVKIFQFKAEYQSVINQNLPEPQASLLSGILLGSQRGIPELLSDDFNITGTSHLIAISGSHIIIITNLLMSLTLALGLSRKKSFGVITLILVIYVILVGLPASAVRAALMGWLVLLAMNIGRLNQSTNVIIFVAALMVLISPKILRDDIGFQLSFAAVIGIIYFMPFLDQWLEKLPSVFDLKQLITMTLAAQIATLPLIIFYFGRFSLIGVLANIVVLPIFTYLMIAGFGAIGASLIMTNYSLFFFWPIYLILSYLIKMVELLALVPNAAINL